MATFLITGEFLTDHARNLAIERDWQSAARFLIESLDGMSLDAAMNLIRGNKKLIGDSRDGLQLGDDSDRTIDQHYAAMYSHAIYSRSKYWIPYAQVVSWGDGDIGSGANNRWHSQGAESIPVDLPGFQAKMIEFSLSRSCAYMDDTVNDMAMLVEGKAILYKQAPPPPLWISVSINPSLPDNLPQRGAHQKRFWKRSIIEQGGPDDVEPSGSGQECLAMLAESAGVDPEKAAGLAAAMYGDLPDVVPEPVDRPVRYGYVSPSGEFYECMYHGHSDLASRIASRVLDLSEFADGESVLDQQGWIRLSVGLDQVPYAIETKPPTQEQRNAVARWFRLHGGDCRIDKLH